MHKVDADLAAGSAATYDPALAVDGIGEVLDVWMPLISKRIRPPDLIAPVLLTCTDQADQWLLTPAEGAPATVGPEPPSVDSADTIGGTANDLLLALWKRPATVTVSGDAAQRLLDSQLTP